MRIAVPKETYPGERRVAMVPGVVPLLSKNKLEVAVQSGAGTAAGHPDSQYVEKGATIVESRQKLLRSADVLLYVRALGANSEQGQQDLESLREGQIVIGTCDPLGNPQAVRKLAEKGVSLLALEMIPRITRAQSMDVLSSMATIAGYKAVLLAADHLPRLFPLLMTAAGTVAAAKVLVIGAGVAGLQAIATARRLGASVQGYDVRPAAMEQIESLGAKAVSLQLQTEDAEDKGGYAKQLTEAQEQSQRELLADVVAQHDVCITTAAIPGKQSPLLVTADAVRRMPPGGVVVDLAAERGGNCELTRADEVVMQDNVTVLGPTNLSSDVPGHASQMYAKNVANLLAHLVKEGQIEFNRDDEITRDTLVAHQGEVVSERIRDLLSLDPLPEPTQQLPDPTRQLPEEAPPVSEENQPSTDAAAHDEYQLEQPSE